MIQEINRAGRYTGCLLGLALGDALGTTQEFKKRGTNDAIKDIIGGGPYELNAGEWTDCTSMSMCVTESLIEQHRFIALDIMSRLLEWHENGYWSARDFCFGISDDVRNVVQQFKKDTSSAKHASMNDGKNSSDSLSRLAPIPLFFLKDPELAISSSIESVKLTHNSEQCVDAGILLTNILLGALLGENKEVILAENYQSGNLDKQPYKYCDRIAEIANCSYKEKPEFYIKSDNNAANSLEAALWAFHNSSNFKEGALLAANLGENSATIASVYGQIAGAYYGIDGLPDNWLRKLAFLKKIRECAENLWLASLK